MAKGFEDLGFVPVAAAPASANSREPANEFSDLGFQQETDQEKKKRELKEKFDKPLLAGVAGAARGVTFGLSDAAAKTLGLDDELALLKEENPTASSVGEVGGAIGGAFFGPGALLARGAATATKGIANQIVARAGAAAIEGGVYGVGQTLSEESLKENGFKPDEVAESLLSHVGVGALLGGGISLGATGIGSGVSKLSGNIQKFFKGGDDAAQVSKPKSWLQKQAEFFRSETKVDKANIANINAAAIEEAIPLSASQTTGSPVLQNVRSSLAQSPTFLGAGERAADLATREAMIARGGDILADATKATDDSIGASLKSDLNQVFKARHSELNEAYEALEPELRRIKVSSVQKQQAAESFYRSDLIRISPDGSEAKLAGVFARDLQNVKHLNDLKILRTKVNGELSKAYRLGDSNSISVLEHIKSNINSVRDASIESAALKATGGAVKDAAEVTEETIRAIRSTDKKYAVLNKDAVQFAEKTGLGKVKGVKQLYDKLDTISNEKLAGKLFNTNNAGSMRYMKETFPNQFESLRKFTLGQILETATREDRIHIPSLIRATKNLSPEAKEMLFGFQGARSLKNLGTLSEAFPKMVGPSGTAQGIQYNNILNPFTYAEDLAKLAAVRGAPLVEKAMGEQNRAVAEKLGAFLRPISKGSQVGAIKSVTINRGDYQSRLDHLASLASDPEKLSDVVSKSTKGIASYNQDVQDAVTQRVIDATAYLQSKAPKNPGVEDIFEGAKWRPSDSELSRWNRYVKAVDEPLSILDDFKSRVLTEQSVDAVKTIYPELYGKITKAAFNLVSTQKHKLKFDDKIQLSILLGLPVSSVINPDFVKRLQADFPAAESADPQTPSGNQSRGPRLSRDASFSQSAQSETERILSRRS